MTARKGQSVSEYALAGAMIAVVSVGALLFFMDELAAIMPDVADRAFGGGGGAGTGGGAPPSPYGNIPQDVIDAATVDLEVTLSNGTTVSVPGYPSDVELLVETAGASGTTDILATTLQNLAEQLVESGEITEEEANFLQELANQGHLIADIERFVAEDLTVTWDPSLPAGGNYVYTASDGSDNYVHEESGFELHAEYAAVRLFDYNESVDFSTVAWEENGPEGPGYYYPNSNGTLLPVDQDAPGKLFGFLAYQASESGALDNPAVRAIVEDLTGHIMSVGTEFSSDWTEFIMDEVMDQPEVTEFTSEDIQEYLDAQASEYTDTDSSDICTVGGGQDSGIQCG